ncbi:sideroflexin-2-like [Xenia sp. Carnegie-2017]|uniref:sideroflexin-2-like n=1 Tax=Xenia sp. Carnegie-2017 TaxID=2897299 RepID=UPI001F045324|nr:sideroflexin-2-like [Xenia sp. Carnegie-2017]
MISMQDSNNGRINLDFPRWDQSTFLGRFRHFAEITNMLLSLKSDHQLNEAKNLLELYRVNKEPSGTTNDEIWDAKILYESAFHPDSGEKMNLFGRMSFQVPGGMLLTGALLQFYKTIPQVVFWQWVNQSFNALVNYTNRNAKSTTTGKQIGIAYVSSTTTAVAVSVGLNSLVKRSPPIIARYVPFVAVAAANCVNIPLSRQSELLNGIKVYDKEGEELGMSKRAAMKGIGQVVTSRVAMAAPGMLIIPIIMEKLEKFRWMQRIKILHMPLQVLLCGVSLSFMVPVACSIFPQKCSMSVKHLEKELQDKIRQSKNTSTVYFNKGL